MEQSSTEKARHRQYRVAIRRDPSMLWRWQSTRLGSLNALLQWFQFYRVIPRECLRVFSFSSREEMNEQLMRENLGLPYTSVPARQFLQERLLSSEAVNRDSSGDGDEERALVPSAASTYVCLNQSSRLVLASHEQRMSALEKKRRELEDGAGGDHDVPYSFETLSLP